MLGSKLPFRPVHGGPILPRIASASLAVLSLLSPEFLAAQSVVPPGAAYVEAPEDAAVTTSARWLTPPGRSRVLHVAFAKPPAGRDAFWDEALSALDTWSAVPDLPVRFRITGATDSADIEFRWTDRFPTSQAGAAHRRLDRDGYIRRVIVVLAREHADGSPMSDEFRRLVALHEVGHALGLPHSDDPGDVMHPGNRNFTISHRDLRSLAALYASPTLPTSRESR